MCNTLMMNNVAMPPAIAIMTLYPTFRYESYLTGGQLRIRLVV